MVDKARAQPTRKMCVVWDVSVGRMVLRKRKDERGDNMKILVAVVVIDILAIAWSMVTAEVREDWR